MNKKRFLCGDGRRRAAHFPGSSILPYLGRYHEPEGTDPPDRVGKGEGRRSSREHNLRARVRYPAVSENGPREGTRDLPRPGPEAGRRNIDKGSATGVAYGNLSRSLRRRRAEIVALVKAGGTPSTIATSYRAEHPLEPEVTPGEIRAALAEAKVTARPTSARIVQERRSRVRSSTE
jgi:hypothetical protein